jgi:hypothetical protein
MQDFSLADLNAIKMSVVFFSCGFDWQRNPGTFNNLTIEIWCKYETRADTGICPYTRDFINNSIQHC